MTMDYVVVNIEYQTDNLGLEGFQANNNLKPFSRMCFLCHLDMCQLFLLEILLYRIVGELM